MPFKKGSIMERIAVYPGTFDPITNGHLDIIKRGRRIFDKVIVAVALNIDKSPLFTPEQRVDMIRETVAEFDNVEVCTFNTLVVDYCHQVGASAMIRGLRAVSDFESEFQMALINRKMAKDVESVFLMPKEKYTYLSSSLIKEIVTFGGDVSCFVPNAVEKRLKEKFKNKE